MAETHRMTYGLLAGWKQNLSPNHKVFNKMNLQVHFFSSLFCMGVLSNLAATFTTLWLSQSGFCIKINKNKPY